MVNGYKDLFEGPSASELQAQFNEIVGDSFETIDPSMQALFDGANQNVNTAAQDICSDLGRGSLSLDQAILACLFHHVENFCPKADADEDLPTFLKTLRWKLDDVVFDWSAAPPPPPPVVHGPYEDLLAADPEGMEIAREKIMEFWPQLSCALPTFAPPPRALLQAPVCLSPQEHCAADLGRQRGPRALGRRARVRARVVRHCNSNPLAYRLATDARSPCVCAAT